jgi:homoserine/homoserine lactone efflux protein
MFVSLTNPKALLASIIVYPLFLRAEYLYTSQAAVLSLTAIVISFSVYSSYSIAAIALQNKLAISKLANKTAGSMYLGSASTLVSK